MRIEDALQKYIEEAGITDYKQYYSNEIMDAFIAGFNAANRQIEDNVYRHNKRLFRWQRRGLNESLETMIEVENFADIEDAVNKHCETLGMKGLYCDLRTKFNGDDSDRCGDEWKTTFYVIATVLGEGPHIIGYSNFPKE